MADPLACRDLAAAVVLEPAPVIFLDTASILDVLRVPFRHELQTDILDSASTIVDDALATPKRLWLVTTANVVQELGNRRQFVQDELSGRIRDLTSSISRLLIVARMVFPERRLGSLDLLELRIEQRVSAVMDQLVGSVVIFSGTAACVQKARDRLWAGVPPASRSKQEFKDCEIFEEFLELLSAIRQHGFLPPAVFVTPNSTDYGPAPEGYPQIALALAAVGSLYAKNLSWALASIRA